MTDQLTKKFTNNTLEEDLRTMLVEKNNECNALREEIKMLKNSVAEEQDAKYRAYVKISDLQRQLNTTK
jgi:chromosome segregation ATPase